MVMMEYKLKNQAFLAIKLEALYQKTIGLSMTGVWPESRKDFVKSKKKRSLSIPERREALRIADILVWETQG
jgi:hypothetical protein